MNSYSQFCRLEERGPETQSHLLWSLSLQREAGGERATSRRQASSSFLTPPSLSSLLPVPALHQSFCHSLPSEYFPLISPFPSVFSLLSSYLSFSWSGLLPSRSECSTNSPFPPLSSSRHPVLRDPIPPQSTPPLSRTLPLPSQPLPLHSTHLPCRAPQFLRGTCLQPSAPPLSPSCWRLAGWQRGAGSAGLARSPPESHA